MNWHNATETPKDDEKCLLRVIRDNGKNEIRMGTACVFVNSHFWYDENPPGCMSRRYRPPTQVIQPYEYGDPATKPTCLWLRGLPRLVPTRIVQPPPAHRFPSGNSMGAWYYATSKAKDRARARSKTFPGIAAAMAAQWHAWLAEPFRLVPDIDKGK